MNENQRLDSSHLLHFIFNNRKKFFLIGVVTTALASVVSLMMTEQFQSSVVMFATPQHSIGEQFYEEVKRNDLLEYGETEDAERLLQILNSDRIRSILSAAHLARKHYSEKNTTPMSMHG
jgi:DNA-directed RNA polymerase specialized sigma54-like protein